MPPGFRGTSLEAPATEMNHPLVPDEKHLSAPLVSFGINSPITYRQGITPLSSLSYSRRLTYRRTRRSHPPTRRIATLATPEAGQR